MTADDATLTRSTGVRRLASRRSSAAIARSLEARGVRTFVIDLHRIRDKDGLLRTWSAALGAPGWTGRNWDALEEAMGDLSWARAADYAVIVTGARRLAREEPGMWSTALAILRRASADWNVRGVPMAILVRGGVDLHQT